MRKLVAYAVAVCAAVLVIGCPEEAAKECVVDCAEWEVCVDGDCETACETHDDCFNSNGGGWHCEKSNEVSYCALGVPPAGDYDQPIPECVAGQEVCDGKDNDCDGVVDEGVKNACGKCGAVPTEVCDSVDNDCDGQTDEGLLNACGKCGALPTEVCDGVDNDCDGKVDEDLLNACGQCGAVPSEVCNGKDDDCDSKVPDVESDADADGFRICEGDCNDLNAVVNPSATEICNGLDDNCNGKVLEGEWDEDLDGVMACEGDCDDTDKAIYPTATELCNDVDDDCDGDTDELFFIGVPCLSPGACAAVAGVFECASEVAAICSTMPGASSDASSAELCSDNTDNDCDGAVDEGCDCDIDDLKLCGTTDVGECSIGLQTCGNDGKWGDCVGSIEPTAELCNGLDDDCDGLVPFNEADKDADGERVCDGDCDDLVATVHTGSLEVCDGVDDDCDGAVDEDFFVDVPCTGLGACSVAGGIYECDGSDAYLCSTMPSGSNDASSAEVCGDNIDNDCDGSVDEDCVCDPDDLKVCGTTDVGECALGLQVCDATGVWGDCQGNVESGPELCDGLDNNCNGSIPAEEADADNDGFMICENDCNDDDLSVNSTALELCDGVDDDCDGAVDEDFFVGVPCYSPGTCGFGVYECDGPDAYRCSTAPGASEDASDVEVCGDNADNDCDNVVDEDCDCDPGDQKVCGTTDVGECKLGWQECSADGTWGLCLNAVEPQPEVCNDADDNCDGETDEGVLNACGECGAVPIEVCDGADNDCDDVVDNGVLNACGECGAVPLETCNGEDDDCDGATDEDYFVGAPCDGVGFCGVGELECAGIEAVACSTNPGASADASQPEVCGDNADNDCDGSVDEGCECDPDDQKVCGSSDVGECKLGWQECSADGTWGDCVGSIESKAEECNGLDDNCNGAVGVAEVDSDADGEMICAGDCNDDDAAINTEADEFCNGVDDDCNGDTDEGFFVSVPCIGLGACGAGIYECAGQFGYQCSTMPNGSANASSPEVCGDNTDNDCDGSVDEGCECDPGDLKICGTSDVGVCQYGTQLCANDGQWLVCQGSVEPSPEQCNGFDDNCNGGVPADETDSDSDDEMVCAGDCNDDNASVNSLAEELCNGVDDDCGGDTDEGFFIGAPCVGLGACGAGKLECADSEQTICSTMPGASADASQPEVCGDNADNDCDGSVDEGCECDPGDQKVCGTSDVGECKFGWQECSADGTWDVCVGNVDPKDEQCNGFDDDCNGLVPVNEADADKDSWRVCENDCDDNDKDVSPGETELCNGQDDNCDTSVDENCSAVSCNICCGYGLGQPVVWWGDDPPNTWSGSDYCGVWTGTVQQICLRGDYPVPGYTDAGWVDWNCQNGTFWGGWQATGVLWCVNDLGQLVDYEVVSGQVDPAAPDPEGEVILLDGLCSE